VKPETARSKASRRALLVGALLASHATMLAWGAFCHSPAWDEVGHLPAGLSHWKLGRIDLYRVNPPLVRMIAALPVLACDAQIDWSHYSTDDTTRSEFDVGKSFIEANGERFPWFFTVARWACIPFSLIGGVICWNWASRLYGATAGFIALVLWCVCPNVLGHGQLITPDVGGASLGAVAAYAFWRWLKGPTWLVTAAAGVAMGLAELTKTTWIILFLLWPILAIFWTASQPRALRIGLLSRAYKMAVILLLALYVLNFGYGFEGSFTMLGKYRFLSSALRDDSLGGPAVGNRFADTWLGAIPIPIPKNYLQGIDMQKRDFEMRMPSYLRGKWKMGGWYHYYVYAMLLKVPLGTWLIGLLAIVVSILPRKWLPDHSRSAAPFSHGDRNVAVGPTPEQSTWRDEVVLLSPAIVVLLVVSLQIGFNHHLRYVLPAFPFLFVWVSKVGRYAGLADLGFGRDASTVRLPTNVVVARRFLAALIAAALLWSASSSLRVYPHSLSYFNELVGGPTEGHLYLGDSNVDWGQDLWYVKGWYDEHPEARPLHLSCFMPLIDPRIVDIEYEPVPAGPVMNRAGTLKTPNWPWEDTAQAADSSLSDLDRGQQEPVVGPLPGWFIVSVNVIHRRQGNYEYFQEFEPVDKIGYSMNVYHITPQQANRVRRKLGMQPLDTDDRNRS
jgi:4-amino-4-deoxy-L-arabinose transferase-like glycosyltransferase